MLKCTSVLPESICCLSNVAQMKAPGSIMQINLQRRPCGFFKPIFPVSLQQLLVVIVKDCRLLCSSAYLLTYLNLNTNETTLLALKCLQSCVFGQQKLNLTLWSVIMVFYILSVWMAFLTTIIFYEMILRLLNYIFNNSTYSIRHIQA